jgi:hypothetical protein
MWHASGRGEVYAKISWENPRKMHHFEDLGIYWRVIVEWILKGRLEECGLGCFGS